MPGRLVASLLGWEWVEAGFLEESAAFQLGLGLQERRPNHSWATPCRGKRHHQRETLVATRPCQIQTELLRPSEKKPLLLGGLSPRVLLAKSLGRG